VRRACVLALALSLLAASTASAKGGVIFDRYPDVQALGSPMKFTAMTMRRGASPLVTFRDQKTGTVIRVRASKGDLNGISYGTVRLPSHGPWDTQITIGGRPAAPADAEPFRVGVGLTQTISSADAERRAAPASAASAGGDGSAAWPWIAAAAVLASGLVLVVLVRRRPRGAA
jgi:hypothetical protein